MIEVRKQTQKPITVIRAASGHELSNYEKHKLAHIEENAQENKIEAIKVNGQRLQITEKEVNLELDNFLGELANKDMVTSSDISAKDLFFITCEVE